MKLKLIIAVLLMTTWFVHGQGTFIYDQHSTNLIEGSAGLDPSTQPMGQSFTPAFSSVGFVQLNLFDSDVLHSSGETVFVNLRSNSITGTILSSTTPVFIPDAFFNTTNFFFSTPATVVPGVTYYLQPVIQSGDFVSSYVTDGSYAGGIAFVEGSAWANHNLWFQEGVIAVPEPSSAVLILTGVCLLACFRAKGVYNCQRFQYEKTKMFP
jgi:hypothetical protein